MYKLQFVIIWRAIYHIITNKNKFRKKLNLVGGKLVILEDIKKGSTIISAGLGDDIEFEIKMIQKKNVNVIGIDPTEESKRILDQAIKFKRIKSNKFILINKLLGPTNTPKKLYLPDNGFMSSTNDNYSEINKSKYKYVESITIKELLKEYNNISYLKIDIEGCEYEILGNIADVCDIKQISIEFHHYCINNVSIFNTLEVIHSFIDKNYDVVDYTQLAHKDKKLKKGVALWKNLNCEFLLIKK